MKINLSPEELKLVILCLDEMSHKIRCTAIYPYRDKDKQLVKNIDNIIDKLEGE